MNDRIVKPESAIALDDVTARTGELIELLHAIEGSRHASELAAGLAGERARIEGHLDALLEARQARGELPSIGNVERAQLTGLVLRFETLAPADAAVEHVAERLVAACDATLEAIAASRRLVPGDALEMRLEELREAIDGLRHALVD